MPWRLSGVVVDFAVSVAGAKKVLEHLMPRGLARSTCRGALTIVRHASGMAWVAPSVTVFVESHPIRDDRRTLSPCLASARVMKSGRICEDSDDLNDNVYQNARPGAWRRTFVVRLAEALRLVRTVGWTGNWWETSNAPAHSRLNSVQDAMAVRPRTQRR